MEKFDGGKIRRRSFTSIERELRSLWGVRAAVTVLQCLVFALCVMPPLSFANGPDEISDRLVDFNIPQQRADLALLEFAEQADITLAVRPEEVGDVVANALVGRYRIQEGIEILLADTRLTPVLKNAMILSVRVERSSTEEGGGMNPKKLGLMAAVAVALSGGNASAQDNSSDMVEEIVVTGIRGSLQRALDVKENAGGVVDAISAEDLGKFPDQNVAESLQRITGVAITRSRGGEGELVTVRGLGQAFNAVTYNDRLIATENAGREFSFDVIASELISAAQVYKTPTASQGDGSVGGRVNVVSARPLDNPGFRVAGTLSAINDDLSGETEPKYSALISNTWGDDRFGILGSFTYSKRDLRSDVIESIGFNSGGNTPIDANGDIDDPNDAVPSAGVARLSSFAASVSTQERERTGGTLAFQFAPDDASTLTLDALYTRLEAPALVSGWSMFPGNTSLIVRDSLILNDITPPQVIGYDTVGPVGAVLVGRENIIDTDTIMFGANWEKDNGNGFRYSLDAAWSKADGIRDNVGSAAGSGSFFVLNQGGLPGTSFFTLRPNGGSVPDITYVTSVDGVSPNGPLTNLSADSLRPAFSRVDTNEIEDEVLQLKGDFAFEFSDSGEVLFGFDYVGREKTARAFSTGSQFGPVSPISTISPELANGFFSTFDDDFLSAANGNIPRAFPVFDPTLVYDLFEAAGQGSDLIPLFNPAASNVIEERVLGAFVQVNLDGELGEIPYSLNAGVRIADTDLTSTGEGQLRDQFTLVVIDNVGNEQQITAPTGAISIDNSYFDVLPSFNIVFDLSDNLKLRGAFSESLSRPTLTALSTTFNVTSTNGGSEAISSGNPGLEPVRSNNFDISLEWYGDAGLSASAAVFHKDITNFIANENVFETILINNVIDGIPGSPTNGDNLAPRNVDFLISRPSNGDAAEITGLELAAQKIFENGFGLSANVTLTDSSLDSALGLNTDLIDVSDTSYNASIFYENHGWQARVSLNQRGEYLATTAGEGGFPEFVDDFTQVDASVSYSFNDNVTVFVEGINLTDEEFFRFSITPDQLETFEQNGARYLFGVRVNF